MKKTIWMILAVCLLLNGNLAYAYTVDDPDMSHELEDGQSYVNGEVRNDIKNIQDVGNGYLCTKTQEDGQEQRCFTTDFISFRNVDTHKSAPCLYP